MHTLYIDLETYSDVPIAHGTHAYAAAAEILLLAWAVDDGPVSVWDMTLAPCGGTMPRALRQALEDRSTVLCAHNSHFDRTVLIHTAPYWGDATQHRFEDARGWRDTMVRALAHSLPGRLGDLCSVLRIPTDQAKDKEGRQLVLLFCKPRPATSKISRATRETHPDEWAKFVEYARLDVEAMRAVDARLPRWNDTAEERALWRLDQTINDRGVQVDTELAEAAVRAVAREQQSLADQAAEMTDGAVRAATQRDALLAHVLAEYGIALPDMQKSTLERRIADPDLPAALRELLAVRLQASTTSTAKYRALLRGASTDGRLRGTLQFCGASRTGRWAGRLFQPQNLPRPTLDQAEIDSGIEALRADVADLVIPGSVMELTSSAVRGCLVARRGCKLVVSDLSNIEGRVLAWLAGESWKLRAFADFDAGTGADLYKLAYAKSFGVSPDAVTKDQRQVGKVQELALGYEGGVGAFLTFAANYRLDLEAMADQAFHAIPASRRMDAAGMLQWARDNKRPTFGLSDRAFIVCESFKRAWRDAHPATVALWRGVQDAARAAMQQPGRAVGCQALSFERQGAWLLVRLPSGRCLCYPAAQLAEGGALTYMGVDQYSRKWSRLATYGGKLVENITQAVARDVLAASMAATEAAGYDIVLTVHDELITETPDSPEFSAEKLAALMAAPPPWAAGLPLAAAGFEATRYRKD